MKNGIIALLFALLALSLATQTREPRAAIEDTTAVRR